MPGELPDTFRSFDVGFSPVGTSEDVRLPLPLGGMQTSGGQPL